MKKECNLNSAKCSGVKSNLVDKLSLEVLSERHNALARYIGIPCVVEADSVFKGAAMADGTIGQPKGYACYRVDLGHFKGDFSRVRFRAVGDGKNVAFGFLVDKDGKVEYVDSLYCRKIIFILALKVHVHMIEDLVLMIVIKRKLKNRIHA